MEERNAESSDMWEKIRNDFPILKEQIYGHDLIYLDNAATTQLPQQVLDCWMEHYTKYNANVHRGIHYLSEQSTSHMEDVRRKLKQFIGAEKDDELIFTSGATDAANLVAQSFLKQRLSPGDVVLCTELEHHSDFVVWQQLCLECGAEFRLIPVTEQGDIDFEKAHSMVNEKVKFLAITAVSNVTGTVVDTEKLIKMAHSYEIPVYIDGAQAMRHVKFAVSASECDFFGFSGHKMMGPTGVGALYISHKRKSQMRPYRYGGGMVDLVRSRNTVFAGLPDMLEAGTPNYSGIIAWGRAVDYLQQIGVQNIADREAKLLEQTEAVLTQLDPIHILGKPKRRAGAISVTIEGVHSYDFACMMDKYGVAVRSGSLCAQPIVQKLGADTVVRISPAFYNTVEEVNLFGRYAEKVIAFFQSYK